MGTLSIMSDEIIQTIDIGNDRIRDLIFSYLRQLDATPSDALCDEIEQFLDREICIRMTADTLDSALH